MVSGDGGLEITRDIRRRGLWSAVCIWLEFGVSFLHLDLLKWWSNNTYYVDG